MIALQEPPTAAVATTKRDNDDVDVHFIGNRKKFFRIIFFLSSVGGFLFCFLFLYFRLLLFREPSKWLLDASFRQAKKFIITENWKRKKRLKLLWFISVLTKINSTIYINNNNNNDNNNEAKRKTVMKITIKIRKKSNVKQKVHFKRLCVTQMAIDTVFHFG